jgi:hypothetical protein
MRLFGVAFLAFGLLGCDRLLHRHASAGADAAVTSAIEPEEEDEGTTDDAGACPLPIHPAYCRRNCRTIANRRATKHARRVAHPMRAGLGECGAYDVFAEDEALGDAGVREGITEYYDKTGGLVAAVDTRSKPCGRFGTIPTCTPVIVWERTVTVRLGRLTATGSRLPFEVIERVARQSMPRFKECSTRADAGVDAVFGKRVVAQIRIEADGRVSSATDAGSDVASDDVKSCVMHVFTSMTMPEPDGHAAMTVTIPVLFGS